jgi:hypothetical protein
MTREAHSVRDIGSIEGLRDRSSGIGGRLLGGSQRRSGSHRAADQVIHGAAEKFVVRTCNRCEFSASVTKPATSRAGRH